MKKNLGMLLMFVICLVLLPLSVKAIGVNPTPVCSQSGTQKTCSFDVIVDSSTTEASFTLTPEGGAVINSVARSDNAALDWDVTYTQSNGVWTVTIKASNGAISSWNQPVFTYTYTESGQADCNIDYHPVAPQTTPTQPEPTPENPQTGSTLPYIALGAIVLVATGAYLTTRNKSKMYKI